MSQKASAGLAAGHERRGDPFLDAHGGPVSDPLPDCLSGRVEPAG